MGGPKNHGSVVGMQAERGNYDPKVSMINFTVPDVKVYNKSVLCT